MLREVSVGVYILLLGALLAANTFIYRNLFAAPLTDISTFRIKNEVATLVHTQSGKWLLIDTGANASILRNLGTTMPPWKRSLDAIVLTKPNPIGLLSVQNRYQVHNVMRYGTATIPYGSTLTLGTLSVTGIRAGVYSLTEESETLLISSTTAPETRHFK